MKKHHRIKTWMPYFADVANGKKPFEFRINDRDYQVGDDIEHKEFDPEKNEETGRICHTTISYVLKGGQFGIPESHCVFAQHTFGHKDYIRDYDNLSNNILPRYEEKLPYKRGGDLTQRIDHVLSEFNTAALNSVWKAKNFVDDVKTQFKALELVVEGIAGEHYNHGQKRTIANHVIHMLRSMVDKMDRVNFDYSMSIYERYNYFRSDSPEGDLLKKYKELKQENDRIKQEARLIVEKLPDDQKVDLPF